MLDIVQYLERVPERLIPRKQELIEALKKQESGTAKTGGQGCGADARRDERKHADALSRAAESVTERIARQTAMRSR